MTARGYLPALPGSQELRHELSLRLFALILSNVVYFSVESGIAYTEDKRGTMVFDALSSVVNFASALYLALSSLRKIESELSSLARFVAMTDTFSVSLAFSAVGGAMVSVGDRQYTSAFIEAGMFALGMIGLATVALIQRVNASVKTATSLLEVVTYRYADGSKRAMAAGTVLGPAPVAVTFTYFAANRQDYGSASSGVLSFCTTAGLFFKMLRNQVADETEGRNGFSLRVITESAIASCAVGFLLNALADFLNKRPNIQPISQAIAGLALMSIVVCLKAEAYFCKKPEGEEGRTLLVP